MYGKSECGKSFLVLQLALDLASKGSFLGFDVLHKCRVGMLQAEMSDFRSQERYNKLAANYPNGLEVASVHVEDLKLDTKNGAGRYEAWLDEVKPDVVIIDPLRAFFAGSENDSDAVERWFTGLAVVHQERLITPVYTHHTTKEGAGGGYEEGSKESARGSGLITDRPSTAISLVVNKAQTEWKVTFTKTRNRFRHPDPIVLTVNRESGLFEIHAELDATASYCLLVVTAMDGERRLQPEVVKELVQRTGSDERTVRDWITKTEQRGLVTRKRVGSGSAAPYMLIPFGLTTVKESNKVEIDETIVAEGL